MTTNLEIRCPNCGSLAYRRVFHDGTTACPDQPVVHTECPVCDYFMVMCWQTGKVLEAYYPIGQATAAPDPFVLPHPTPLYLQAPESTAPPVGTFRDCYVNP